MVAELTPSEETSFHFRIALLQCFTIIGIVTFATTAIVYGEKHKNMPVGVEVTCYILLLLPIFLIALVLIKYQVRRRNYVMEIV